MAILEDNALYYSILEKVASYDYGVGSQIRIRALEQQFRVSSIPIRECLIRLSGEDFVDFLPGKGFFMKKPNVDCFRRQLDIIAAEFFRLIDATSRNDNHDHQTHTSLFFDSIGELLFDYSAIADFIHKARLNSIELARLLESNVKDCVVFHPMVRLFPYYSYRRKPSVRDQYFAIRESLAARDFARAQLNVQSYIEIEYLLLPEACREIAYALLTTGDRISGE